MNWKALIVSTAVLGGSVVFGMELAAKVQVKRRELASVQVEAAEKAKKAAEVVPPVLVKPVATTRQGSVHLTGTLAPEATVDLAFKIPGRVVRTHFGRGDRVEAGALLAEIETREIAVQAAQARAAMKVAKAQRRAASIALVRTQKLTDAGVSTPQQLELAEGQASVTSAAISQAMAAAEAVDALAAETTISAPIAGTLTLAPTSVGFLANPGVPLYRIETLEKLKFTGHLSERDAVRIAIGAGITVTSEAAKVGRGKVTLILGSLDPQTHRVPVEGVVHNPGGLFSGALVDAEIDVEPTPVLSLPITALLTGEVPAVLVLAGQVLERRVLQVLETDDGQLYIRGGLGVTDRVVDRPGTAWRAGDRLPAEAPEKT